MREKGEEGINGRNKTNFLMLGRNEDVSILVSAVCYTHVYLPSTEYNIYFIVLTVQYVSFYFILNSFPLILFFVF